MNRLIKSAIALAMLAAVGAAGAAEPVAVQGAVTQQASTVAPRDAASGRPTGKRQHKPVAAVTDSDGDQAADATVRSPRDAASGQASGKRTHAPVASSDTDDDCDGEADDERVSSSPSSTTAADGSTPACTQKTSPLYDDQGREVRNPPYTGNK